MALAGILFTRTYYSDQKGTVYLSADLPRALSYLRSSADAGEAEAMRQLGKLCQHGHGVPKDLAEAKRWYEKAASAGNQEAKEDLEQLKKLQVAEK